MHASLFRVILSAVPGFLLLLCPFAGTAGVTPNTVISYTFDNHTYREANNQTTARYLGAPLVEDRFGNDRSAVGVNGHINSYLNLGVSPLLRPQTGTISLWVNIGVRVYSGKGSTVCPILLMKNGPVDDWYEAIALYYQGQNQTFAAVCTKDSLNEAAIHSVNRLEFGKWYHLVLTISDNWVAFYVNGKLQGRAKKDFDIRFLETDSLMIGHTANRKNQRFISGAVDDIRIYHRLLSPKEILELYNAPNPNRAALILQEVLYWSGIAGGIVVVSFLLVWQRRRRFRRARERLDLNRQLHEMEIRTLKAQMNPHFIFNALNAIQVFIMSRDNRKAEAYLSKFSKLLRELLESNANESLSVSEEAAILKGYLEIESLRFGKSFSYSVTVDERIDAGQTRIPHMLIQPFVENAIWHGLLKIETERRLEVALAYDSPQTVRCTIDDNGIGRLASPSKQETFKRKSLALSIVQQRLALMSTLLNIHCDVQITDKTTAAGQSAGTLVTVLLPILPNN